MAVLAVVMTSLAAVVAMAAPNPGQVEAINFLMPEVQPQEPDTYLCRAIKIEDSHRYITGFIPNANAMIAHHILLYGCLEPGGAEDEIWNCGEMSTSNKNYRTSSICQTGTSIIYAWAMEAPRLTLPPEVSFDVGQDTGIKYLVLQVHYKNVTSFKPPNNQKDSSGLTLITTTAPTTKTAAVYLLGTGGEIPQHSIEYFETACTIQEDVEIVPFAYRTHAHALGRVISGYRIRNGEWTEIGRKDPRLPEMFYNVTSSGITVKKGDILAARCTMENTLDHTVQIGPTQNDEMCNFYIMYYVEKLPSLNQKNCFTVGPPNWFWDDFNDQKSLNLQNVPTTVSVIPGSDTPLICSATCKSDNDPNGIVEGLPGRFDDDAVNEVPRFNGPDELLKFIHSREEEDYQDEIISRWQKHQLIQEYLNAAEEPSN
ncbi:unnamed protein product [Lymnaea stagnalis]|uniref:peptidylglycine monooxygenase n=1 Tax=Lymnaea stagnalis TaxID=6523 RepID=A0AAV2HMY2_LYMST